ncbi:MAG: M20 family peptidase [bacterium]
MGIPIIIVLLGLVAILCFRAAMVKKPQLPESTHPVHLDIDVTRVADHLSRVVQKQTISNTDLSRVNWTPYQEFVDLLVESYPNVHRHLERETVNEYSLIYRWKGQAPDLKPVLLIAHSDVVPVEKSTADQWEHPPFSGVIADGFVWGRGTMDMKLHLISILEAIEALLADGFTPQRDIYLAFGHDEETRGELGASSMARLFAERGMTFDFVLDEGGCVTHGGFALLNKPMAMVGIAEKGITSIRLTVEGTGGHASMPPRHTAVGVLAKVIADLEKQQFETRICAPVREQFECLGSELPFYLRLLTANLWLFGPLFKRLMARSNVGNAMLRTTTAATMIEGSMAHNVLPPRASAIVNFRLLPGETIADVLAHIKKIAGLPTMVIEPLMADDPSLVSPSDSDGFSRVENTIHRIFPGVLVTPYLVMGGTDARRYETVCRNIYRFSPMLIEQSDLDRIHNVNERISLENIERSVQFFQTLIADL